MEKKETPKKKEAKETRVLPPLLLLRLFGPWAAATDTDGYAEQKEPIKKWNKTRLKKKYPGAENEAEPS